LPRSTPSIAIVVLVLVSTAVGLLLGEVALRVIGLGNPVLYETDPTYGYRPRPNQSVGRLEGATVRINNLGIRASADWDGNIENKVLFLGNSVTYGGSYVSNGELFAELAVPRDSGWVGGSGGVNAWGVENIHGLIVDRGFLPARVYVTVLIEDDFYRGFAEKPSYLRTSEPGLALIELWPHIQAQTRALLIALRLLPAPPPTPDPVRRAIVAKAVDALRDLDGFLGSKGFVHLMYLSPYRAQLEGTQPPDSLLAAALDAAGLKVDRIAHRPEVAGLPRDSIAALYHDPVHLSSRGHQVWASMLRRDLAAVLAPVPAPAVGGG
jgi:hypothetical protein